MPNAGTNTQPPKEGPGRRKLQVRKGDLYMFTALWMQESPWAMKSTEDLNVVGSVFVLPNDRVLSADCTRQHPDHNMAVHGAIRPLIKYPDKVKGCQVYLTRKPCAHCVKMLVQAGVSKVFYLPLQLEMPHETGENKSVDALFKVSEVSREFYIPDITRNHVEKLTEQNKKNLYTTNTTTTLHTFVKDFKERQKWNDIWIDNIEEVLDWQEFRNIKVAIYEYMDEAFDWFCQATFATGKTSEMEWKEIGENRREPTREEQLEFSHLSRLAQMLSNRTDDPNTGVGCVIANEKEIVSIGWNGFPSKALYGNHPRGSHDDDKKKDHAQGSDKDETDAQKKKDLAQGSDKDETDAQTKKDLENSQKKYPHVIYAEHNALLSRNERNLENSVAYVNNIPGDDCMAMLYEMGVQRLVLPPKEDDTALCFNNLLRSEKIKVLRYTESVDQVTSTSEEND